MYDIKATPQNLLQVLQAHAHEKEKKKAFLFLENGEEEKHSYTYGDLDQRARAIAAVLQQTASPGDRALLLYPPGLDFVAAFFGCIYAGIIAVPAYPPRMNKHFKRLQAVVQDAEAKLALTVSPMKKMILQAFPNVEEKMSLQLISTDQIADGHSQAWKEPKVNGDTLAFLQYTSGSTGSPKGVMVSHHNLLHNIKMMQTAFQLDSDSVFVSWLPVYHDMGLIGNVLHAAVLGSTCVLLSPEDFLKRPIRWLQAITKYRATFSGAPNFAYELCIRRISSEQKKSLDLSDWKCAFNGAEPIRAETLDRFAKEFAESGLKKESLYPCYGLAEATLFVSGGDVYAFPTILHVEKEVLKQGKVVVREHKSDETQSFVSCGRAWSEQKIVVVDPITREVKSENEVGEIWLSGASVAQGYWDRSTDTQDTFQVFLEDPEQEHYLRTGDLGFIHQNELYIAGRQKDLIIIRGRNYYPQDIEYTVEESRPEIRKGCVATFSIEHNQEEQLVVVAEVKSLPPCLEEKRKVLNEVMLEVKKSISENHELKLHDMVLIKERTIPKTSSGKIQRRECKQQYLEGTLIHLEDH